MQRYNGLLPHRSSAGTWVQVANESPGERHFVNRPLLSLELCMKKPLPRLLLAVLTACLTCSSWAQPASTEPALAAPFSPDAYLEHIKYLASDELAGRQTGAEGCELAAEYIARQFVDAGLKPGGDDGTFFQPFEVTRGKQLVDSAAVLKAQGIDQHWEVRKDWIPLPFSAETEVEGPLAFAGYGIEAESFHYDDYADFDATGKVLLIFRYEPPADDPAADFGGKTPSRYAVFSKKAQTAAEHGAIGLLIVNPPKRQGADDTLFAFDNELSEQTFDLPMVHVTRAVGEALVEKGGLGDLASLEEKLDRDRKPLSADLKLTVELKPGVRPNRLPTRNVLGWLPGGGDTEETIVLGAHYDHLGRARSARHHHDDRLYIHHGADDNASGTAAVIEMARRLSHEPRLRRNVLFITFSGEEMGLLGSAYYVAHPTIPLAHIKAMVNFDMIGRLSQKKFTIYGLPSGKELGDIVDRAAVQAGIKYRAPLAGMFEMSDHASFYEHDIPVLFAFTGLHKQYHQPEDRWELIDAEGAARILTMFHQIVRDLGDLPAGPMFEKVAPPPEGEEDEALKIGDEHEHEENAHANEGESNTDHGERHNADDAPRPKRPRVRLGIVPEYAAEGPGLLVDSVIEGTPAAAAGLLAGDRIVRIGDAKVKDVHGYMAALRDRQPGETLEVVVVRKVDDKSKEVTLKVTLK
jgi:hypothetical protein